MDEGENDGFFEFLTEPFHLPWNLFVGVLETRNSRGISPVGFVNKLVSWVSLTWLSRPNF